MKRFVATAFLAVTCLAGIGTALAQQHAVKATVPFDFSVRNKQLPPGEYRITSISRNMVAISNPEKGITVLSLFFEDDRPSGPQGKLVFRRYGDQYFLSQIVGPGASKCLDIPPSKLEKRVRWQQSELRFNEQIFMAFK